MLKETQTKYYKTVQKVNDKWSKHQNLISTGTVSVKFYVLID